MTDEGKCHLRVEFMDIISKLERAITSDRTLLNREVLKVTAERDRLMEKAADDVAQIGELLKENRRLKLALSSIQHSPWRPWRASLRKEAAHALE